MLKFQSVSEKLAKNLTGLLFDSPCKLRFNLATQLLNYSGHPLQVPRICSLTTGVFLSSHRSSAIKIHS